ncbi:unnamed protein product [Prunus armeniaca]
MNNASQSMQGALTVDIPPFFKKYKKVSTREPQDDTTAVGTEPATREPSYSDYTLAMMLESPRADSPWDGNYVAGKYRNIIRVGFDDLWHHPLLMSPNERYYFPIDATMTLQNKKMGAWRDKYRQSESIDIKATIEKSKCDKDIKLFYEKAKYQDNALGVLDYSKNISLHFQRQNSLTKDLEEELTSLFPERLTYLYNFLYGLGINMRFLLKR